MAGAVRGGMGGYGRGEQGQGREGQGMTGLGRFKCVVTLSLHNPDNGLSM